MPSNCVLIIYQYGCACDMLSPLRTLYRPRAVLEGLNCPDLYENACTDASVIWSDVSLNHSEGSRHEISEPPPVIKRPRRNPGGSPNTLTGRQQVTSWKTGGTRSPTSPTRPPPFEVRTRSLLGQPPNTLQGSEKNCAFLAKKVGERYRSNRAKSLLVSRVLFSENPLAFLREPIRTLPPLSSIVRVSS